MLTLKDFVKQTLTQIVEAAHDFEEEQFETVSTLNPRLARANRQQWADQGLILASLDSNDGTSYATVIDFDIAVSAEDTEASKAGGGIRVVSVFKAEGNLESRAVSSSVSRVRFRLPLQIR